MGNRDLPRPLKIAAPRAPRLRWLGCFLSVLACCGPALAAQGALSRDFEQAFLARREAEIDRAYARASEERKQDALVPIGRALAIRANSILNGERSKLLAEALAVLQGLEYGKDAKGEIVFKDKQRYADFCWRFNLWLLALPEVVDPLKSKLDEERVLEIFRGAMPKLDSVVGPQQRLKDNQIHITVRGVFGLPKPKEFTLQMGIRQPGGQVLASKVRKDSEDPGGWRVFDLTLGFPMDGYGAGYYEAFAESTIEGRKAQASDPRILCTFENRPGFYRELWTLFSMRKRLSDRMAKSQSETAGASKSDLARLDALTMELYRAFVLGKEYGFRSWTQESLDQALRLVEALLDKEQPKQSPVGDGLYGVSLTDGKSLPVRLIHGKPDQAGQRRATIWFAPLYWDKDWAVEGLGLSRSLFQRPGEIHVFLYHQPQKGYLEGIQALLQEKFACGPDRFRIVGVQDGARRARFALPLFVRPPKEFVTVGSSLNPLPILEEGIPVQLVRAQGLPTAEGWTRIQKAIQATREDSSKKLSPLRFAGANMESLAEAISTWLAPD